MLTMKDKTALVLAPHTDDGEFGCGGTLARLLDEGGSVHYAAFSICRDSVPAGYAEDTLKWELLDATHTLGIARKNVHIFDYPVRRFPENRQAILDDMIVLGREIQPDIVFAPSLHDVHQDHAVIAQEARRAFKRVTLLGYEMPWNDFCFDSQLFIGVTREQLARKRAAIECYKTQQGRPYSDPAFLEGQLRVHGVQAGCDLAEVFEVMRCIVN